MWDHLDWELLFYRAHDYEWKTLHKTVVMKWSKLPSEVLEIISYCGLGSIVAEKAVGCDDDEYLRDAGGPPPVFGGPPLLTWLAVALYILAKVNKHSVHVLLITLLFPIVIQWDKAARAYNTIIAYFSHGQKSYY